MWLANGYKVRRTADGTAVAIEDVEGLTHAICQALARKVDVSTPVSSATCAPCSPCLLATSTSAPSRRGSAATRGAGADVGRSAQRSRSRRLTRPVERPRLLP